MRQQLPAPPTVEQQLRWVREDMARLAAARRSLLRLVFFLTVACIAMAGGAAVAWGTVSRLQQFLAACGRPV